MGECCAAPMRARGLAIAIVVSSCGAGHPPYQVHRELGHQRAARPTFPQEVRTPFYVSSESEITLTALPSGHARTLLVVVPDFSWHGYSLPARVNEDTRIQISVHAVGRSADTADHHEIHPSDLGRTSCAPAASQQSQQVLNKSPSDRITLFVPSQSNRLPTLGRLQYAGSHFAFYEDVSDFNALSLDEYRNISQLIEEHYPQLEQIFGPASDVDKNGRIIVLFSHTVVRQGAGKGGQGFVDYCDVDSHGAHCADSNHGEIIYVSAMDVVETADSLRRYYVGNWYPRLILHESVHLSQFEHALRMHVGDAPSGLVPPTYLEGQAQLVRFVTDLGVNELTGSARRWIAGQEHQGDFEDSGGYSIGGVFAWWIKERFGECVHGRLLDAFLVHDLKSPFLAVTGLDEATLWAEFYASIYLNGTEYGATYGLRLPPRPGASIDLAAPTEVRAGWSRSTDVPHDGHIGLMIRESSPMEITITPQGGRVVALVAQP